MGNFKDLGSLSQVKGNRERPNFLLYNIKVLEIVGFCVLTILYYVYIYLICVHICPSYMAVVVENASARAGDTGSPLIWEDSARHGATKPG